MDDIKKPVLTRTDINLLFEKGKNLFCEYAKSAKEGKFNITLRISLDGGIDFEVYEYDSQYLYTKEQYLDSDTTRYIEATHKMPKGDT